jgi:hypothetical protein
LYTTQVFVNFKLSKAQNHPSKTVQLYLFCAKALAINFFRIPSIGAIIISVVTVDPENLFKFFQKFEKIHGFTFPADPSDILKLSSQHNKINNNSNNNNNNNNNNSKNNSNNNSNNNSSNNNSNQIDSNTTNTTNNNNSSSSSIPSTSININIIPTITSNNNTVDIGNNSINEIKEKAKNKELIRSASSPILTKQANTMTSSFPLLFQWDLYHNALAKKMSDSQVFLIIFIL